MGQGLPDPLGIVLEVVGTQDHGIAGEDKSTHQLLGAIPGHQGLGAGPAQQPGEQRDGLETLRSSRGGLQSKPEQRGQEDRKANGPGEPQTPSLSTLVSVDPLREGGRLFAPNLSGFQPRPEPGAGGESASQKA